MLISRLTLVVAVVVASILGVGSLHMGLPAVACMTHCWLLRMSGEEAEVGRHLQQHGQGRHRSPPG